MYKVVTTCYRKAVNPNIYQMEHKEISQQIDLLIKVGVVGASGKVENRPEMAHK